MRFIYEPITIAYNYLYFIVLSFQFCRNNNQKYIDFYRSVIDVSSKIVPLETKILLVGNPLFHKDLLKYYETNIK